MEELRNHEDVTEIHEPELARAAIEAGHDLEQTFADCLRAEVCAATKSRAHVGWNPEDERPCLACVDSIESRVERAKHRAFVLGAVETLLHLELLSLARGHEVKAAARGAKEGAELVFGVHARRVSRPRSPSNFAARDVVD